MRSCAILSAPWRDPAAVLSAFADDLYALGFLSGGTGPDARWSYLARAPEAVLIITPEDADDPFAALTAFAGDPSEMQSGGPPFQGGVAGLACYELGARAEPVILSRRDGWPDLVCGRYPAVLAFDHLNQAVFAIGRGASQVQAHEKAKTAMGWLDSPAVSGTDTGIAENFESQDGEAYEQAVSAVKRAIADGDLFQANIARVWRGQLTPGARPFDLLRRLRTSSPAPFAGYFRLADRAVVTNSPERFVKLSPDADGLLAQTRPIKGTAPRAIDPVEDDRLAEGLRVSVKDRAENLMIVDLMRNDLARVCTPGGVEVVELYKLETFANVHHLVSTVTGRMAKGQSASDLLRAAFPPGSVTGAPKVQAMKTIASLEAPRGPYCGSLFWLGMDGAMESNVLIRTAVFETTMEGWQVEARAGGGIVADSDPAAERLETEAKIDAIRKALS